MSFEGAEFVVPFFSGSQVLIKKSSNDKSCHFIDNLRVRGREPEREKKINSTPKSKF
jgi:hypothetical protein